MGVEQRGVIPPEVLSNTEKKKSVKNKILVSIGWDAAKHVLQYGLAAASFGGLTNLGVFSDLFDANPKMVLTASYVLNYTTFLLESYMNLKVVEKSKFETGPSALVTASYYALDSFLDRFPVLGEGKVKKEVRDWGAILISMGISSAFRETVFNNHIVADYKGNKGKAAGNIGSSVFNIGQSVVDAGILGIWGKNGKNGNGKGVK